MPPAELAADPLPVGVPTIIRQQFTKSYRQTGRRSFVDDDELSFIAEYADGSKVEFHTIRNDWQHLVRGFV